MPSLATTLAPEQGQIVVIRQRRYVVTDVLPATLPLLATSGLKHPQHLVTLNSIEDDAATESAQLVWEIEPGALTVEQMELPEPDGFDPPARLDAFLDAVRWGAIASADMRALQAPFRSGIEIEDYQLDPLIRAVQMPRVSLLIADDVGLGKTVEAGLVIQELIVRSRARTVLVVCPAGLQAHWRDQMRDKFGLEFRIVDSALMRQLRRSRGIHANPWSHFPRLITSIDFLKREGPMRRFREIVPDQASYPRRFDILIVDEAHNVAPPGHGLTPLDSQRTHAVRAISPHFEHKLFLTATPHNGFRESFSALLELLDNQRFARGVQPNPRQLEAVMVRRLKSELVDWDGKPRFPRRHLAAIEVDYSADEKQVHAWLHEYSRLRQQNATDDTERFATEFVLKLLKKRLFSSPAAFAITLARHRETLAGHGEGKPTSRPASGVLRRQIAQIDEDYADDAEYEDAAGGAIEVSSRAFTALTPRERWLLEQMAQWAEKASAQRDCKTRALITWLRSIVKPDSNWSDERVILFTEYRATQNWLQEILAAEGLATGERLLTLYGGMDDALRERVKAAFQASPQQSRVRILLATDAASEGIDLQNHCHRLVHLEIPWNPNRMEQRNGRIDRHGQHHDPLVYHFVAKGYRRQSDFGTVPASELEADLEFLARAAEKVEQIREDLGKVGPVIAAQVEEAMLGKRARLDTVYAESEASAVRKLLKFERDLRKQIAEHYAQVQETRRTLDLTPANVQAVVETALALAGQPPLIRVWNGSGQDTKTHREEDKENLVSLAFWREAYFLPPLTGSWASCVDGLAHPHTGELRPIVFDHELARDRDDVVLAHLNHRLVQMALRLLRAEVWSPEGRRGLFRVTTRVVPNHALDTPAVIAHARLVVTGGSGHRLHEEIITAGGAIREGRFVRFNVGQTLDALRAASDQPVSETMQSRLQELWPRLREPLAAALEARMRDRTAGLAKLLTERATKEARDIETVLNELAATIGGELNDPRYQQLSLFGDFERKRLSFNAEVLAARLYRIPNEIAAEQGAIRKRYADPEPRLFPVAVTFLVPGKLD